MKYENRQQFEHICRTNVRYNRTQNKKYTRCHNSFWLLMYPNDRAISDNISAYGYWEPWDSMAMSNILEDRKDWTFIDVGANIGYYTMMAADIGVDVVHAFECNPKMIPYIRDSVNINKFKNVSIHEIGLGDKDETATLSINHVNFGGASFIKQDNEDSHVVVNVTTMDKRLAELDKPFVAKVDVEGYERQVWWGAKNLRGANDNIWFVEWFNNRWSEIDQRSFLEEVSKTHRLCWTTHKGTIEETSIDKVVQTYFATLVFIKK